jgi:hypothetical protein
LAEEVAFHLGEGGLDLQEGAAGGGGRVHRRVEGFEADAALLEPVDQDDQVVRQPSEAVEVEDDEDIVAAQGVCQEFRVEASFTMRP